MTAHQGNQPKGKWFKKLYRVAVPDAYLFFKYQQVGHEWIEEHNTQKTIRVNSTSYS